MATLDLHVGSTYLAQANAVAAKFGVPSDLGDFFKNEMPAISAIVAAGKDLGQSGIGAAKEAIAADMRVASAPASKSGASLA